MINQGTIRVINGATLNLPAGTSFINDTTGTFTVSSNVNFDGAGGGGATGLFTNKGLFQKTGGGGNTSFSPFINFRNSGGIIHITSGSITDPASTVLDGATTFSIAPGSAFFFANPQNNNNVAISGTITGSGGGIIEFDQGTFISRTADGTSTAAILNFPDGMALVTGQIGNWHCRNQPWRDDHQHRLHRLHHR